MTAAQKAEATKNVVTFEFRGESYTLDPLNLTWETLDNDAAGNFTAVIRDLLGEEQFAKFKKQCPRPLEVVDGEFVNAAAEMRVMMLDAMGNLAASSGS